MRLWNSIKKINIDPKNDNTYKQFSEDEQIERYANNYMFWLKLHQEQIDIKKPPDLPRLHYITSKK